MQVILLKIKSLYLVLILSKSFIKRVFKPCGDCGYTITSLASLLFEKKYTCLNLFYLFILNQSKTQVSWQECFNPAVIVFTLFFLKKLNLTKKKKKCIITMGGLKTIPGA